MHESESYVEKRRFTRIPFEASVHLHSRKGDWYGKLRDISLKGVLITRPHGWASKPGEQFILEVNAPGNVFDINMDVEVAHIEDDEIGFKCNRIDLDSMSQLRRLVELNLGDEQLLQRELSLLGKE